MDDMDHTHRDLPASRTRRGQRLEQGFRPVPLALEVHTHNEPTPTAATQSAGVGGQLLLHASEGPSRRQEHFNEAWGAGQQQ